MSSVFSSSILSWNDLVGLSTTLESARRRSFLASQSDLPVLLLGEPGVGKETFARLIAQESNPQPRAFVKLSAKRLTSNNWNELLSLPTSKGSGATFSELVDGVLYLTDVERASLEIQRRFASKLQMSTLAFRVLFATEQPFLRLREKRAFDAEFESFLLGFPIFLHPLRERKNDFSELSNAFFRQATNRLGVPSRELTPLELQSLASREYPENLDDLYKTLETLAETGDFSKRISSEVGGSTDKNAPFLTIDEAAKRHIEEALRRSNGVVEGQNGAAKALDINPYTLRARMRKLKIDWTKFRPEEET